MDIELLVKLTSRAWSLSILAHMDRGVPGRQAALISATGAGRTSFRQSLDHLIDLRLLERNPGHGHPLRPEFRLTAEGAEIARIAHRVEALAMSPAPFRSAVATLTWTPIGASASATSSP